MFNLFKSKKRREEEERQRDEIRERAERQRIDEERQKIAKQKREEENKLKVVKNQNEQFGSLALMNIITTEDKQKFLAYNIHTQYVSPLGIQLNRTLTSILYSNEYLKTFSREKWIELVKIGAAYILEMNPPQGIIYSGSLCAIIGLGLKGGCNINWIDDIVVDFIGMFPMKVYGQIIDARDLDRYMYLVDRKVEESYIKFNYFETDFRDIIPKYPMFTEMLTLQELLAIN